LILSSKDYEKPLNSKIFPGIQGGPLMHIIAAKAVSFQEALTKEFKDYQEQVVKNAKVLADTMVENGLKLVSGGTDNHLMLVDLTDNNITGKDAENVLGRAEITVNKNTVPFETRSPFVTSGIRIGTPAVTTRGMKEPEMKLVGELIAKVVNNSEDENIVKDVKNKVIDLCKSFPLYKGSLF
jgi:glycine hydroxymethyltransferase